MTVTVIDQQFIERLRAFNADWCRDAEPTVLQLAAMLSLFGLRLVVRPIEAEESK